MGTAAYGARDFARAAAAFARVADRFAGSRHEPAALFDAGPGLRGARVSGGWRRSGSAALCARLRGAGRARGRLQGGRVPVPAGRAGRRPCDAGGHRRAPGAAGRGAGAGADAAGRGGAGGRPARRRRAEPAAGAGRLAVGERAGAARSLLPGPGRVQPGRDLPRLVPGPGGRPFARRRRQAAGGPGAQGRDAALGPGPLPARHPHGRRSLGGGLGVPASATCTTTSAGSSWRLRCRRAWTTRRRGPTAPSCAGGCGCWPPRR